MNNPPTAVGGIPADLLGLLSTLSMNDPPTAVGGIPADVLSLLFRLSMNNRSLNLQSSTLGCKLMFGGNQECEKLYSC